MFAAVAVRVVTRLANFLGQLLRKSFCVFRKYDKCILRYSWQG